MALALASEAMMGEIEVGVNGGDKEKELEEVSKHGVEKRMWVGEAVVVCDCNK